MKTAEKKDSQGICFIGEVKMEDFLRTFVEDKPGPIVNLEGKASWMCCGRDCNPGFKDLSIELPVAIATTPPDGRWSRRFAEGFASIAKPPGDWAVEAECKGGEVILHIKAASDRAKSHFEKVHEVTFFTEDGLIDPNKPESLRRNATEFILTQTISEFAPKPFPKHLFGILQTPQGWLRDGTPKCIRISVPLRE